MDRQSGAFNWGRLMRVKSDWTCLQCSKRLNAIERELFRLTLTNLLHSLGEFPFYDYFTTFWHQARQSGEKSERRKNSDWLMCIETMAFRRKRQQEQSLDRRAGDRRQNLVLNETPLKQIRIEVVCWEETTQAHCGNVCANIGNEEDNKQIDIQLERV